MAKVIKFCGEGGYTQVVLHQDLHPTTARKIHEKLEEEHAKLPQFYKYHFYQQFSYLDTTSGELVDIAVTSDGLRPLDRI